VKVVSDRLQVPLRLDSSYPNALAAAVDVASGRALIICFGLPDRQAINQKFLDLSFSAGANPCGRRYLFRCMKVLEHIGKI
jgi:hypothetical protein